MVENYVDVNWCFYGILSGIFAFTILAMCVLPFFKLGNTCPKCNAKVFSDYSYCIKCGEKVHCDCGALVSGNYCVKCGGALNEK